MKKFGEGIKDFFYDAIDYILMVLIVVVVAGVIGWRLDVLFDKNDKGKPQIEHKIEVSKNSHKSSKNSSSVKDKSDNNKNSINSNEEEFIKIVIPPGSPCEKIAEILKSQGIIDNKEEFLSKAGELKLDTKLKSGEFEIKKNSSMEDILNNLSK